jgi:threonine dehydratase
MILKAYFDRKIQSSVQEATVFVAGDTWDDCYDKAAAIARKNGWELIEISDQ